MHQQCLQYDYEHKRQLEAVAEAQENTARSLDRQYGALREQVQLLEVQVHVCEEETRQKDDALEHSIANLSQQIYTYIDKCSQSFVTHSQLSTELRLADTLSTSSVVPGLGDNMHSSGETAGDCFKYNESRDAGDGERLRVQVKGDVVIASGKECRPSPHSLPRLHLQNFRTPSAAGRSPVWRPLSPASSHQAEHSATAPFISSGSQGDDAGVKMSESKFQLAEQESNAGNQDYEASPGSLPLSVTPSRSPSSTPFCSPGASFIEVSSSPMTISYAGVTNEPVCSPGAPCSPPPLAAPAQSSKTTPSHSITNTGGWSTTSSLLASQASKEESGKEEQKRRHESRLRSSAMRRMVSLSPFAASNKS